MERNICSRPRREWKIAVMQMWGSFQGWINLHYSLQFFDNNVSSEDASSRRMCNRISVACARLVVGCRRTVSRFSSLSFCFPIEHTNCLLCHRSPGMNLKTVESCKIVVTLDARVKLNVALKVPDKSQRERAPRWTWEYSNWRSHVNRWNNIASRNLKKKRRHTLLPSNSIHYH